MLLLPQSWLTGRNQTQTSKVIKVQKRHFNFDIFLLDNEILKFVKNKTKTAAWIVSNCKARSPRKELVTKMQSLGLEVDIYGGCGNLTTPRHGEERELLENNYKFYFAFENCLCIDYVTEKLFKVMKWNIIPVVYGGANYSRFVPPMSYISANDFETADDLVKHLKFLATNPKEYVKYFWWKKHYRVESVNQFFKNWHLCKICEKINDPFLKYKHQSYHNIYDWFHHNTCGNSTIKFD